MQPVSYRKFKTIEQEMKTFNYNLYLTYYVGLPNRLKKKFRAIIFISLFNLTVI